MSFERVLIATRGELARRLIRHYRGLGLETVAVFSEPDVDQPWVDEADYAVFLNGSTVRDTYMDASRVLSAALDAGADLLHPGYCFLAERVDFHHLAAQSNIRVVGADPQPIERVNDRFTVRELARQLDIPVVPASDPLPESSDGLDEATRLGSSRLYVKAVRGGVVQPVTSYDDLPNTLAMARDLAEYVTGSRAVYLEAGLGAIRQLGTTVVADRHGAVFPLGHADKSLQLGFRSWVEEIGPELVPLDAHQAMGLAAIRLTRALDWVGLGRVRWAWTPSGGWFLLGFSGRLTTGYTLTESVFDVDLVDAQHRVTLGEPLGWEEGDPLAPMHGVQLRILHVDPGDGVSRPEGTLVSLELPEGVRADVGSAPGQTFTEDTEPLVASLVVTGPTRQATLVKARAALEATVVEGLSTNLPVLAAALSDEDVWANRHDVHVLDRYVDARRATS